MVELGPSQSSEEVKNIASNGASGDGGVLAKKRYSSYLTFDIIMSAILPQFSLYYSKAKSFVYDTVILRMTEKWYRTVLERLDDGSILLDVGIGTGGECVHNN